MASPSSPAERSNAHFLRRALELLAAESPGRYAELAACARKSPGRLQVGGESLVVTAREERIEVTADRRPEAVRIEVDLPPRAIFAVVDGTATIEQLLARGEIEVKGGAEALLQLATALRVFAGAAVASRALQHEFERYRDWVLASYGA